ncbi:hypothetical protein JCM3765_006238 [Sporobolomyces pararoseus]
MKKSPPPVVVLDSKELLPPPNLSFIPSPRPARKNRNLIISVLIVSLSLLFYSQLDERSGGYDESGSENSIRGYYQQFITNKETSSEIKWGNHQHLQFQELQKEFLKIPSPESAREISKFFTQKVHIAGTKNDQLSSERLKNLWQSLLKLNQTGIGENVFDAGTRQDRENLMGNKGHHRRGREGGIGKWRIIIERFFSSPFFLFSSSHHHHHHNERDDDKPRVWISTYYPYLNYPISSSLTLSNPLNSTLLFNASLTETSFPDQDPSSIKGSPVFHGFSKNGTVKNAQLVYASRGTLEDFQRLKREGIDLKDKVVLVQYGGSFRGLKIKLAQEYGAIGCLIYTDPISDGEITEENGFKVYPFGPSRQPSSVQRGSVQFLSIRPGDPLTPFEPAYNPNLKNSPIRLPMNDTTRLNIPDIPSLPISYQDAIPLLESLKGKGIKREDRLKDGWKEGGLGYKGVEYWTGPSGPDRVIELKNEMKDGINKIWNTMAIIPGVLKDEIVVIGNHNDAWTFGAGDPNSGTTSMYETFKSFTHLINNQNWKPFRTILLCSWDAEEYGLIGSTEFGEDFLEFLRDRVVSYLNLDVSVSGSKFELAASPSLADLLKQTTKLVENPVSSSSSSSNDDELVKVKTLGSGSDFSVFLQYIGIASGNLGFTSNTSVDPVYHYHSNFDSFNWMEKFGDPNFEKHVYVSKILGLTALRLIEDLILPLNTTAYAVELKGYLKKVIELDSYPGKEILDLTNLNTKLVRLVQTSSILDQRAQDLVEKLSQLQVEAEESISSSHHHHHRRRSRKEKKKILKEIREINKKKKGFETSLLVPPGEKGLKGREWYKSLVVAPGRWLGYGATTLPGLTEALELDKDLKLARKEVKRLEDALERAIRLLEI